MASRNLEDNALSGLTRWASGSLLMGLAVWTWRFAPTPLSPAVMDSFLHLPNLVSLNDTRGRNYFTVRKVGA